MLRNYVLKINWNLLELSLSNKEFLIKGLCEGDGGKAPVKFGYDAFYQKDIAELEVFQVLLHMTNKQGWINEKHISCSIHLNPTTEIQGKHNLYKVVENYDGGYVWCIETEIGNFMARRNGKVFITGNSGFPKSMNIGLAIDKKNGVESEVVGNGKSGVNSRAYQSLETTTAGEYEIKNEWQGWGTCLKSAYEPIIVARKPLDGTLVDNVLKWGVGGLNIDECRVPISKDDIDMINAKSSKNPTDNYNRNESKKYGDYALNIATSANEQGRFPANTILTYDETDFDEVCGGMPDTKSTGGSPVSVGTFKNIYGTYSGGVKTAHLGGLGDSGSAARYFYCAKASRRDRDEGLNETDSVYVSLPNIPKEVEDNIKRLLNQ